jgi:hypothetical protein
MRWNWLSTINLCVNDPTQLLFEQVDLVDSEPIPQVALEIMHLDLLYFVRFRVFMISR